MFLFTSKDWIQVTQKDAEKTQNPYEYTKPHPPKGVRSPPPEDKKDDIMVEIQTKNSPQLPHRKKNGKQHVVFWHSLHIPNVCCSKHSLCNILV